MNFKECIIFIILLLIGIILILNGLTHVGAIYELQVISGFIITVIVLVFEFIWLID